MLGLSNIGAGIIGGSPAEMPAVTSYDADPVSPEAGKHGKAVANISAGAVGSTSTPAAETNFQAFVDGLSAPVLSEQAADATAAEARVARVYYAHRDCVVTELGVETDSLVPAMADDYVTMTVKKYANGAAIGDALSDALSTHDAGFAARTKRLFTWTNRIYLDAGDMLVVDVVKQGLGVTLPKFEIAGLVQNL